MPSYWISTAIVDQKYNLNKEELIKLFGKYNIDMRPMFYPLSSMEAFKKYTNGVNMMEKNKVTYGLADYGICLPNGNNLVEEDVDYICKAFSNILNNN